MRFTFIQPPGFAGEWKRLRLNDDDLRSLENAIADNPAVGPVMRGAGGLRKMRFAPPSRHAGKSGAMRVCYACFERHGAVYLLAVFAKNERANLTAADRAYFRAYIEAIRAALPPP